jgi:hypothetical protein
MGLWSVAARLLGSEESSPPSFTLPLVQIGERTFAVTTLGAPDLGDELLGFGIELKAFSAILDADGGSDQALDAYTPDIPPEGVELERGSIFPDGTFFGVIEPKYSEHLIRVP